MYNFLYFLNGKLPGQKFFNSAKNTKTFNKILLLMIGTLIFKNDVMPLPSCFEEILYIIH